MADMQAMFCQEKQISFLRFLWWDKGNLDSEITDHEMCLHLFGAVSSPSCSNYALRKSAVDNSSYYGNDAAVAIRRTLTWMTCLNQSKMKNTRKI